MEIQWIRGSVTPSNNDVLIGNDGVKAGVGSDVGSGVGDGGGDGDGK